MDLTRLTRSPFDSRRALMTTSDLKRLDQIQNAYDKRIELGQLFRSETLTFLFFICFSRSKWHKLDAQ